MKRIWIDHKEEEYEEVFKSTYPCAQEYSVYPRLLVRATLIKWLIGSENMIEAEIWKYLTKRSQEFPDAKILFQTKPKDTWVLRIDDVHCVTTLNAQIVIPTSMDGMNVVIESMGVYLKGRV